MPETAASTHAELPQPWPAVRAAAGPAAAPRSTRPPPPAPAPAAAAAAHVVQILLRIQLGGGGEADAALVQLIHPLHQLLAHLHGHVKGGACGDRGRRGAGRVSGHAYGPQYGPGRAPRTQRSKPGAGRRPACSSAPGACSCWVTPPCTTPAKPLPTPGQNTRSVPLAPGSPASVLFSIMRMRPTAEAENLVPSSSLPTMALQGGGREARR